MVLNEILETMDVMGSPNESVTNYTGDNAWDCNELINQMSMTTVNGNTVMHGCDMVYQVSLPWIKQWIERESWRRTEVISQVPPP